MPVQRAGDDRSAAALHTENENRAVDRNVVERSYQPAEVDVVALQLVGIAGSPDDLARDVQRSLFPQLAQPCRDGSSHAAWFGLVEAESG
jgi:hypothetical protein